MKWIIALFAAIGRFFAELIPTIIEEIRRVRRTPYYGKNEDVSTDIDSDIERKLRSQSSETSGRTDADNRN